MSRRDTRFLIFAALAVLSASCSDQYEIVTERFPLPIGESSVDLVVHRSVQPGLSYLNLHDNENTAVDAALAILREEGGTLYELAHTGERNISFQLGDTTFAADPNRIFTERGIDSTLARHGAVSARARGAVRAFSGALLHRLEFSTSSLIVTVHNNSDDRYSVLSYVDGGELAIDALFVYVGGDDDPDDFYFVTSEMLYNELRDTGSNVVMQDNHLAEDDGSLAVLAAREGIPYVNVEAEHGHLEEQQEMVAHLHRIIMETDGE